MFDELKIDATEDTPEVLFDKKSGHLKINGRSLPEDAFTYYVPIIEWLVEYSKNPSELTTITFNLEYFNTASAKQVFKITNLLADLSKNNKVVINWHFDEGDKDMKASGERFSKLCGMPFKMLQN
jgi:hypothetical protein